MKAAYLNGNAWPEDLVLGDLPRPKPAEGELLIKVQATAITPTELRWFPTFKTRGGEPRPFPIVLSHEFSGRIAGGGHASKEHCARGASIWEWASTPGGGEPDVVLASAGDIPTQEIVGSQVSLAARPSSR